MMDYVLTTALKNEEHNVFDLVNSVKCQTLLPLKWIIVNDGSTDKSLTRLKEETKDLDFVQIIDEIVNEEYSWETISKVYRRAEQELTNIKEPFSFVGVLDGDSFVEPSCFEELAKFLNANPNVATVSTEIYVKRANEWVIERDDEGLRGPVRLHNRKYFEEVGGTPLTPSQESVLDIKYLNKGYKIKKLKHVKGFQSHKTGSRIGVNFDYKRGRIASVLGYRIPFVLGMAASTAINKRPRLISGAYYLKGYLFARMQDKRLNEPDVVLYSKRVVVERLKNIFKQSKRCM